MTGSVIAIDFPDKVDKLVLWGSHSRADKQSVDFGNSKKKLHHIQSSMYNIIGIAK